MHCGKSYESQHTVDGVLEGSECIVVKEINTRTYFGIWHLPQCVLAKVKVEHKHVEENACAATILFEPIYLSLIHI